MDSLENKLIKVGEYNFELYIDDQEISEIVQRLAAEITADYADKNPIFLIILSGAFIFAADLLRYIEFENDMSLVKVKSYDGLKSTNQLDIILPPDIEISGREVILIEDIIDSGFTLSNFIPYLHKLKPASVEVVSLLFKPDSTKHFFDIKYVGKSISSEFVIGYGLDYDGKARNLRHIYKMSDASLD